MKRFLALAALSLLAFHLPAATSRDVLRAFRNPTDAYRPYVRWWWNGDKVDEAEIRREIRLLKEEGIAGVAYSTGFSSQSYFSRSFKEYFGKAHADQVG